MSEPTREALPDDDDYDFADEHDDTSLADQVRGGPEHAEEPESPDADYDQ
jgi:hypothetical protein